MAASVQLITPASSVIIPGLPILRTVLWTGDSSYPSGGYALAAADVGLSRLDNVLPSGANGLLAMYDHATGKVRLYRTGTSADTAFNEVTAAVNVSTITFRLTVIGA